MSDGVYFPMQPSATHTNHPAMNGWVDTNINVKLVWIGILLSYFNWLVELITNPVM